MHIYPFCSVSRRIFLSRTLSQRRLHKQVTSFANVLIYFTLSDLLRFAIMRKIDDDFVLCSFPPEKKTHKMNEQIENHVKK